MAAIDISPGTERRLYLAVAAVAALALDAAFVDPEPGASVASRLPWALTMLALLAATAAAYRWLPRGVRLALNGVLLRSRLPRRAARPLPAA